jgi:Ca-activated chloride channel homolog
MRTHPSKWILVPAIVVLLTSSFSLLTSSLISSSAQERPAFRTSSELVVLHVSVRDRGGRYVTGLTRDAFTVIDDARPQTLEMFSAEEVPASVGFLIDNSNSMRPSRERVVASAAAFADRAHPQDEIFVLTFNEAVQEAWRPTIVSEMNRATFAAAMSAAIVARGMTAIHDGIASGLSRLERARHTRQVLIVVSDGGDNASRSTLEDTLRRVRASDATIYTIALVDPLLRGGDTKLLRRLARSTGGESFQPRRPQDVPDAFERISKDIRSAYTLAYAPTDSTAAIGPRRRTVKVYVRSPDGGVLSVRTRDGYFEKSQEDRQ